MSLDEKRQKAAAGQNGKPGGSGEAPPWELVVPFDEPTDDAPPFPLDAFPEVVADHVRAVAESVYCPVDYPAVATLAAASAAIGGAYVAKVKTDFYQGAGLYCAIVGEPSAKKSPPIKHVLRPIQKEQSARVARMRQDEADGAEPPAVYGHGEGEVFVQDVTVEKLGEMLQQQPRGLLLYKPELIGWLLGQNQYKAKGVGADRSFFLEVYDSDPITIHRKNMSGGLIYVAHPSLTMVGATQPDVVRDFFTRRDGLAERILWTFPAPLPPRGERWNETPEELSEAWSNRLANLWSREMRRPEKENGRPRANVLVIDDAARPAWQAFTDELAAAIADPDFPPWLRGTFGKFEGTAARLALILQCLDFVGGNGFSLGHGDVIAPRWIEAASELVFYFGAHARRVHDACGADPRLDGAKRILLWITEGNRAQFARSELWSNLRRNPLFRRPEDLSGPLVALITRNYIRSTKSDAEKAPGRPAGPCYDVNPAVLAKTAER